MKTIAETIEEWIADSGMRLGAISDRVGVSRNTITKWRRGETAPKIGDLRRLSVVTHREDDEWYPAVDALIAAGARDE